MKENFIILMVEDEEGVMDVNRRMLRRRGYELREAKNASEAYRFLEHTTPDLLILDIMLPDGNGYDICSFFRRKSENPVIFLTGKGEAKDKVKGLASGCDYYLTKPYSFDELLAAVNRLLDRTVKEQDRNIRARQMKMGNLVLDFPTSSVSINGENIGLTKKEFALLKAFMENRNREISGEELYELAWGQPSAGDIRNIRKHVMNLRKKIRADESEYYDLITIYGKGYILLET